MLSFFPKCSTSRCPLSRGPFQISSNWTHEISDYTTACGPEILFSVFLFCFFAILNIISLCFFLSLSLCFIYFFFICFFLPFFIPHFYFVFTLPSVFLFLSSFLSLLLVMIHSFPFFPSSFSLNLPLFLLLSLFL